MKTKAELEQEIIQITLKIHNEFPELSKYIAEMPENFLGKDNSQLHTKNFKEYYNSLGDVVLKYAKTHAAKDANASENLKLVGYPLYAPSEDIYTKGKEEQDLNPEDISKNKTPNSKEGIANEMDFDEVLSGDDLDIPGSELDDQQESIGSEDEENNYYSLGGDDHNDLDENKG